LAISWAGCQLIHQIGRQGGQSIVSVVRPTVFDRHVPAFDMAGLAQAMAERG
jgi:hypothetical protein